MNWTPEQEQAIYKKDSNILVAAAAGSGKTAVLVERIINKIIKEKIDIDKLLVVTFTNAAASEMRERILKSIYKIIDSEEPQDEETINHLQRQITLLNKASICTIDSFCLDVIKNNFFEIEISPNFRIADTAEIDLLKQEVLEKLFEEKYEKEKLLYISNTDELTRCFNRHAYEERINNLDLREEWIYISMDLNNLKHTNDSLGHAAGDELICAAANCMRESFGKYGNVYRIGGDEFVVIITGNTKEFQSIIESFDRRVAQWHGKLVDSMTISWGYVFSSEKEWDNIYDIAKEADERMYKNKERYYQERNIVRRR